VFADSQRIFLSNQEQVQAVMERILGLKAEKRDAEKELREVREEVGEVRRPLVERHRNKIAMLKFAFLAPFVIVGCWMFFRKRGSNYVSLVYAFDAAVLFLLMTVIHEHFPRRYYKYMFIAMAIAVVVGVLLFIIRQSTKPSRKSLLQRYREAYHAARCPVCHYPIVGENLRSIVPDRRIGRKLPPTLVVEQEGARVYSCPACGTRLFDRCAECQAIRHTLLPHCIHCGAESEAPEKA